MSKSKRWEVSEDSQIYLTVEHKRGKKKPKYSFAVVAKNILISAALIASMNIVKDVEPVYANTNVPVSTTAITSVAKQAVESVKIDRLAGQSRYQTASEIAKSGWSSSDIVVLTYGGNYPDALSAAPLAIKHGAPILLTDKSNLPTDVKSEIQSLNPSKVIVVGGTGVISDTVVGQLRGMGISVERVAGDSRYDTSIEIAKKMGNVSTIMVATGEGYADALGAGAVAGKLGIPIILVPSKGDLPQSVKNYMASHNITKTYVLGGTGAVSEEVARKFPNVTRLHGVSRYDTNISILRHFGSILDTSKVVFATGDGFADALAGAPYAAKTSSPVVLVPKNYNDTITKYLEENRETIKMAVILGGTGIVNTKLVENYLSGNTSTSAPVNETKFEGYYVDRLNTAANFVQTLYNSNVLNASSLNQLAERLLEIETRLNKGDLDYSSNLINAIKRTDNIISGVNPSKPGLEVGSGAQTAFNNVKSRLATVKKQVGIKDEQQNPVSGNVVYAGKITQYGQPLSKTPVPGYEKINVLYGYHTYGANNQTQYDQIMAVAREAKAYAESMDLNTNEGWQWIMQYRSGTAPANIKRVVEGYYHKTLLDLPLSELEKVARAQVMESYLNNYNKNPNYDASGESAWDVLFGHGADCNGDAYIESLVFDMWGYNTQIRASKTHAYSMIEINGKWYVYEAAFYLFDGSYQDRVLVSPTFSGSL